MKYMTPVVFPETSKTVKEYVEEPIEEVEEVVLDDMNVKELRAFAKENGLQLHGAKKKEDIIKEIMKQSD